MLCGQAVNLGLFSCPFDSAGQPPNVTRSHHVGPNWCQICRLEVAVAPSPVLVARAPKTAVPPFGPNQPRRSTADRILIFSKTLHPARISTRLDAEELNRIARDTLWLLRLDSVGYEKCIE